MGSSVKLLNLSILCKNKLFFNKILILSLFCSTLFVASGQNLPLLKITDDRKHIITKDNQPFFWLGGTAWELIHRLKREEINLYLADRAKKGFTVIQTVILAELDGLNTPNAYGQKPLINNNPNKLNEQYFGLVDYVIEKSNELGLYVGLLPTWGDKFNKKWGVGPEIFNAKNAEIYCELIAKRYLNRNNIVWILGGDRIPENKDHFAIISAMAKGIRKVDSIHLITYHPSGGKIASDFLNESWLDLDMFQSGHSRTSKEYNYVLACSQKSTPRPVINGEARYENIIDRFWENKNYGWLDDADARVSAYWSIISGAAGYTYGCNDIWQMYEHSRVPSIQARTGWKTALDLPGAAQMGCMKDFFEGISWQSIITDQSLILNENIEDESYIVSARSKKNEFIIAYTPLGKSIKIDASGLISETIKGYWFNPRNGQYSYIGEFRKNKPLSFKPWAEGWGSDFLLLLVNKNHKITP